MSILAALAVMAAISTSPAASDAPKRPPMPPIGQQTQSGDSVRLEDVVVEGRPLDQMIRNFVEGVAQPNSNRGLARWDQRVCVGVLGLERDGAEYIADRVSTVASDLGLEIGQPGCRPNLVILGTADGNAAATTLANTRRSVFLRGGAGTNLSRRAFREFQEIDRPVRWWQSALPMDVDTGQRAVRLPGDCAGGSCSDIGVPEINLPFASRLRTQIVDNTQYVFVIVDVDQVAHLSAQQLADYIAMVSLAQIDPDADTRSYASILNVINDPEGSETLTDWDMAYLGGLYSAQRHQRNRSAGRSEIVSAIHDAHQQLRSDQPQED